LLSAGELTKKYPGKFPEHAPLLSAGELTSTEAGPTTGTEGFTGDESGTDVSIIACSSHQAQDALIQATPQRPTQRERHHDMGYSGQQKLFSARKLKDGRNGEILKDSQEHQNFLHDDFLRKLLQAHNIEDPTIESPPLEKRGQAVMCVEWFVGCFCVS
jgi:hypothetical protein